MSDSTLKRDLDKGKSVSLYSFNKYITNPYRKKEKILKFWIKTKEKNWIEKKWNGFIENNFIDQFRIWKIEQENCPST